MWFTAAHIRFRGYASFRIQCQENSLDSEELVFFSLGELCNLYNTYFYVTYINLNLCKLQKSSQGAQNKNYYSGIATLFILTGLDILFSEIFKRGYLKSQAPSSSILLAMP